MRNPKSLSLVARCAAILAILSISTPAFPFGVFYSQWLETYPGVESASAVCQVCHVNPGGSEPWNGYGWAIRERLTNNGDSITDALSAVEFFNSDEGADGFNNIEEILNGAYPGWTTAAKNTHYFKDGSTLEDQVAPVFTGSLDPQPELTSHNDLDTLAGDVVTFDWDTIPADEYWVEVGSAAGLVDYFNSGNLTTNTVTANSLPTDGSSTVFMRLWWRKSASAWRSRDYSFTAGTTMVSSVQITSPLPPAMLDPTTTISWDDEMLNQTYWIYSGSRRGAFDYYNSGPIEGGALSTMHELSGLPGDSSPVWVRLWFRPFFSAEWHYLDADYTMRPEVLPFDRSIIENSTELMTFSDPDGEIGITEWWVYVGSDVGLSDIDNSGSLTNTPGESYLLSAEAPELYVRLWYRTATSLRWTFIDYKYYTADGAT